MVPWVGCIARAARTGAGKKKRGSVFLNSPSSIRSFTQTVGGNEGLVSVEKGCSTQTCTPNAIDQMVNSTGLMQFLLPFAQRHNQQASLSGPRRSSIPVIISWILGSCA